MKLKYILPTALLFCVTALNVAHAQTLDQNLAAKLNEAAQKIGRSTPLATEYKNDFYVKLHQIVADANCRGASSKGDTFECKGTPPTVVEATLLRLGQLARDIDAAIVAVGGKTLQQVYEPKLAALEDKIRVGNLDGMEAKPLRDRIKQFFIAPSGKHFVLADVENNYQNLSADVDAAIKLSAASASNNGFLMQYQARLKALQDKVERSPLNAVTKTDLARDLSALSAPILRTGAKPTPAEFAKADADLTAFTARVDQTILLEGSKSFKDLATAKLDFLSEKIRLAKLDRTDAAPLEASVAALRKNIDAVIATIQKKSGGLSLDEFEARLTSVSMDIDSTIALAAQRGRAHTLMEAFTSKANALGAKIAQARLNNFFNNDFVHTLAEITARLPENCRAGLNTNASTKAGHLCDLITLVEGDKRLDALSSTLDTVITAYGTKSVQIIYGTPLNEAMANLNQSLVNPTDKMRLTRNLKSVMDMVADADKAPRSTAAQTERRNKLTPEQLHNDVQAAIAEVNAAIRLSATGK